MNQTNREPANIQPADTMYILFITIIQLIILNWIKQKIKQNNFLYNL